MTLRAAFSLTRSRRLRPETYSKVAGAVVAFLLIALFARQGANLYLAQILVSPPVNPALHSASVGLFALANVAWCALFLSTVAPVITYRGIARTARSPRLSHFPLSTRRIVSAAVASSLTGVPALAPLLLAVVAAALGLRGPVGALYAALLVATGLSGFLIVEAAAWKWRAAEDHLELVETALLAAMILANPDFSIVHGRPQIVLFMHWKIGPAAGLLLLGLPLAGAAAAVIAILTAEAIRGFRVRRRGRSARQPGLVLYRTRIPVGLFAATYAIEIPVILTNPGLATTVRGVVITMVIVRVLWFLAYLFRTEQELGRVIRGPQLLRLRLPAYRTAALYHLALCGFPIALYWLRCVLDRAAAS